MKIHKNFYIVNKKVCYKYTLETETQTFVISDWVKNNRYYIKKYQKNKKNRIRRTQTGWHNKEFNELFGIKN